MKRTYLVWQLEDGLVHAELLDPHPKYKILQRMKLIKNPKVRQRAEIKAATVDEAKKLFTEKYVGVS